MDVTASRRDNGIIIPSLSDIKHLKESSLGQGKNRAWLNPTISKEGVLTHINQDRRLFGHFYTFDNVFIFICLCINMEWSFFGLRPFIVTDVGGICGIV